MSLGALIVVLLLAGILSVSIRKTPEDYLPATWKRTALWVVWVVVVIYLVGQILGGWGQLTNIKVGK